MPIAVAAQACEPMLPGGTLLGSERFSLSFRTLPDRIEVGRHFELAIAICPKPGAAPPQSLHVDAHMPAHRHGMNYAATVTRAPDGHYRAAGLMFHMPGRWEFIFDVRAADRTDRLTRSVQLE